MGSGQDALGPPKVVNIEDLRRIARRRLPQPVFDYLDGGAEDEITLRENTRAFQDITFRPRGAIVIKRCDLTVRVLGRELSSPVMLAPVGYSRLMHPGGEVGGSGYHLHPLDDFRTQTRSRQSRHKRARVVPIVSPGRPGSSRSRD